MVHTRLSTVKKNKYILPTNSNLCNNTNDNDDVSNSVNSYSNDIGIVPELETPTEDVVDLGKITTTELEKTPTTSVTHGENIPNETPSINTTPPSLERKAWIDSCGMPFPPQIEILKNGYKTPKKKLFEVPDHVQVSPNNLTLTP